MAALVIQPAFHALTRFGNPQLEHAMQANPVRIVVPEKQCSIQFNLFSSGDFRTSCDIAQTLLASQMISYEKVEKAEQAVAQITIGTDVIDSFDGLALEENVFKAQRTAFAATVRSTLDKNGYPASAAVGEINRPMLMLIILGLLVVYAAVYAPIGAWMVELFPSRIRYTAISLPYNVGAGWVGGFMPATAFALVAANGNIYVGLWYPVIVLAIAVVVGAVFLPETRGVDLEHAGG